MMARSGAQGPAAEDQREVDASPARGSLGCKRGTQICAQYLRASLQPHTSNFQLRGRLSSADLPLT
ncbi:hypothetical protein JI435_064970 [Parastagonospora nodorum SN15]|uniref:Uncharacterized protein n=1 Tax=Phaeosphaeria nodorum (strain SN15 / ATCC MYA-4574 / FGSC 10173) TaxID=321614 RepID=A0A7U2I2A7_PHANO|nr:hypothetical protein JI435_064970 [Parastagonospora nodorum SN15]